MADAPRREETDAREALARSPLAARLLRRRAAPLGVIDVSHTRRHHARLVGWLAERLGLLGRLTTRYRSGDAGAETGGALVLADKHGQLRRPDDFGVGLPSPYVPAAGMPPGLPPSVPAAAPPNEPRADAGARRVRRAGSPTHDEPRSAAVESSPEVGSRRETVTTETPRAHEQTRPAAAEAGALDLHVHAPAREIRRAAEEVQASGAGHDRGTVNVRTVNEGAAPRPAEKGDRREPSPPSARELSGEARQTTTESAPLVLGPSPRSISSSGEAKVTPALTRERASAAAEQKPSARMREQSPLPLARAPHTTTPTHEPRPSESPNIARDATTNILPVTAPRAAAAELPAERSRVAAQELVWRAPTPGTPQADAAGREETRFTRTPPSGDTRSPSSSPEGEEVTTPDAPRRPGAGRLGHEVEIDVEGLTERVSRLISRQLIVERERRGFKR